MSLQLAAQHLASRGRGPDTTLVHMAPQEVAGLQALAKAHGGTLTTNPDTGLPEAGFLSSILPMVAGAFLGPAGLGLTAMQAGLAGAALGTVATGSLQKGLMAGLGAYGGAGLAGGLMGAGAAGAAETGLTAAGGVLGTNPMVVQPMTFGAETLGAEALGTEALGTGLTSTGGVMGTNPMVAQPMTFGTDTVAQASPITADLAVKNAVPTVTKITPTFSENASQAFQGFKNLGEESGRAAFMDKIGGMGGLAKYGLAGLSPLMFQEPKQRAIAEREKLKPYEYKFAYNPTGAASGYRPVGSPSGYDSSEMQHFDPRFVRTAAGGGLMDIGPVEAMSRSNQSQMAPAYAQGGVSDMAVNPYTGAETFAEGGETKAVSKVEDDPYYTMSGMSGDVYKYLMGQGTAPTAPVRDVPVAAAAPEATGFLKGITSFASPEGIVEIGTGKVTPWSASNPAPTGGFFGGPGAAVTPASGARLGSPFSAITAPEASGEYVEDTSGTKSYLFDPVRGGFTSVAPAKIFRPYTPPATVTDYGGAANGGLMSLAQGGQSHLGDYSDGGRLLRGPGDGVSDSIPASIGDKRPARLADGEFVVPARIVSELGNGSTEAGARKLYAMMDRVQKARGKTVGKDRVAVNSKAERMLPA